MENSSLKSLSEKWAQIWPKLNLSTKEEQLKKLQSLSSQENFWSDTKRAKRIMSEISELQNEIQVAREINYRLQSLNDLTQMSESEGEDLGDDLSIETSALQSDIDKLENSLFLSGPYDSSGAIISIHAGQGGTEAMDWTEMLLRMYLRFAERQKWNVSIADESKGEEAGIKSVTFEVLGRSAYGYLKKESGTHRLVRQSPFNADHLRQTSFALVEVMPIIDEAPDIEIKTDDIKMDSFRSSGPGGQNVQKVSTAVRLTHIPTGLTATAQSERSQLQNKESAMRILRAKLWEIEEAKRRGEISTLKGDYRPASWGNQIRSYVLHPYQMVKDLRTNFETSDTQAVLNGEIEGFIEAELRL